MAKWVPISERPQPMTKTEMREMLTQAIRNTSEPVDPLPKGSKDREPR